jgi:hypothetical protein
VESAENAQHLSAALNLAARDGGQAVALIIGIVPSSMPMGLDVPERWSRLEFEAARIRRLGSEAGQTVQTVLVLADSAGAAVTALAVECQASAICLVYESGWLAALRRWCDPLWRTVLAEASIPIVLGPPPTSGRQTLAAREPVGRTAHQVESRPSPVA